MRVTFILTGLHVIRFKLRFSDSTEWTRRHFILVQFWAYHRQSGNNKRVRETSVLATTHTRNAEKIRAYYYSEYCRQGSSFGIENHIVIGSAYEDTLEENGWQQAVSLHRGDVLLDAHRCDEV